MCGGEISRWATNSGHLVRNDVPSSLQAKVVVSTWRPEICLTPITDLRTQIRAVSSPVMRSVSIITVVLGRPIGAMRFAMFFREMKEDRSRSGSKRELSEARLVRKMEWPTTREISKLAAQVDLFTFNQSPICRDSIPPTKIMTASCSGRAYSALVWSSYEIRQWTALWIRCGLHPPIKHCIQFEYVIKSRGNIVLI